MRWKVVITDYEFEQLDFEETIFEESGLEIEFIKTQCRTEEEVIEAAREADAIINQYAPLSDKVLRNLSKCKVISRYGVGVDTIDLKTASELGIIVCNVPDYGIEEVSNHTVALLMSWTRKIVELNNAVKNGVWDFSVGTPIYRFQNQVLAILGFGKIPKRVVEKVQPLGFQKIVVYDPFVNEDEMKKYGVQKMELDEILQIADIISIHVPLVESTRHLISLKNLEQLKTGVFIINTARGPIIQTEALIEGIRMGKIAGAALDVVEIEPIPLESELLTLPNIYVTPHSAFYSEEAVKELRTKTAKNVVEVLQGVKPTYQVQ